MISLLDVKAHPGNRYMISWENLIRFDLLFIHLSGDKREEENPEAKILKFCNIQESVSSKKFDFFEIIDL